MLWVLTGPAASGHRRSASRSSPSSRLWSAGSRDGLVCAVPTRFVPCRWVCAILAGFCVTLDEFCIVPAEFAPRGMVLHHSGQICTASAGFAPCQGQVCAVPGMVLHHTRWVCTLLDVFCPIPDGFALCQGWVLHHARCVCTVPDGFAPCQGWFCTIPYGFAPCWMFLSHTR